MKNKNNITEGFWRVFIFEPRNSPDSFELKKHGGFVIKNYQDSYIIWFTQDFPLTINQESSVDVNNKNVVKNYLEKNRNVAKTRITYNKFRARSIRYFAMRDCEILNEARDEVITNFRNFRVLNNLTESSFDEFLGSAIKSNQFNVLKD